MKIVEAIQFQINADPGEMAYYVRSLLRSALCLQLPGVWLKRVRSWASSMQCGHWVTFTVQLYSSLSVQRSEHLRLGAIPKGKAL